MIFIHLMDNISETCILSCLLSGINKNQNELMESVLNELIQIDIVYESVKNSHTDIYKVKKELIDKVINKEFYQNYFNKLGIPESVLPKSLDSFSLFMYSSILSILLSNHEKLCISGICLSPENQSEIFGWLNKIKLRIEQSGSKINELFSFIIGRFFSFFDSKKEYNILSVADVKDIFDSNKNNKIFKLKETRNQIWETDEIIVMETNIDDMTPELLSLALDETLKKGALDFIVFPVTMKKGRSAVCVQILCTRDKLESLAELLFEWTTTFGIRMHSVDRWKLKREFVDIKTPYGNLKFKKGIIKEELYKLSPEFEELKKMSMDNNQSPLTLLNNIYRLNQ